MILNPAGPAGFFLPVGVEIDFDGPPASGVYVGQPGRHSRAQSRSIRTTVWFWTRTTPRPPARAAGTVHVAKKATPCPTAPGKKEFAAFVAGHRVGAVWFRRYTRRAPGECVKWEFYMDHPDAPPHCAGRRPEEMTDPHTRNRYPLGQRWDAHPSKAAAVQAMQAALNQEFEHWEAYFSPERPEGVPVAS